MGRYREQGVVLRTYKLGETDRIVVALTQGRGKVRAVAKGVRRPGSRFGGRLEPFSHVDLDLYEGRSLDVISAADLITPFSGVRDDWALSACGSTMVEAADRVAQPDERSTRLFLLLLDGLRALDAVPLAPASVLDAFLLRLAGVSGYAPALDACATCGAPGRHEVFSAAAGGVLCAVHAPFEASALAPQVTELLRGFVAGALGSAGAGAEAEPRARRLAGAVVNGYLTYHLGAPLKAWELVPR